MIIYTSITFFIFTRKGEYEKRFLISLLAAGFFLGGVYTCKNAENQLVYTDINKESHNLSDINGFMIEGEGIVSDISYSDEKVKYLIKKINIHNPYEAHINGSMYVMSAKDRLVYPGQRIYFSGKYKLWESYNNPGEFDYRDYALDNGILGEVEVYSKLKIGGKPDIIKYFILKIKETIKAKIDGITKDPERGVITCILTGDKSGLDETWKKLYKENGIIHLLTVSGLHISFFGYGIFNLVLYITSNINISRMLSIFVTGVFCIMAGAGPSLVRAYIGFIMYIIAVYIGRNYDFLTAFSLAGILILLKSPLILFQSGFLMSCSCIVGIGIIIPVFEVIFIRHDDKINKNINKVWEAFVCAVCFQISSLLINLWFDGKVTLFGFLVNMLTVPLMSFLMLSAVIAVTASFISYKAGFFLFAPAHYILMWYEFVCNKFSKIKWNSFINGRPSVVQIILWFVFLTLFIVFAYRNVVFKRKYLPKFILFIIVPVSILVLHRFPNLYPEIYFLNVGQGDGIVIDLPLNNGVICIDGGSTSRNSIGENLYEPFFTNKAIKKVDYWIITHPDSDHYNGMLELLEDGYNIKNICIPETFKDSELAKKIEEYKNIRYINAGDKFYAEKALFEIVSPEKGLVKDDANDLSAVIYFSYGDFSALFTGDMGTSVEDNVIKRLNGRKINILKAAHHGSKYSTSEEFLKVISPDIAVLSYGKNNRYNHPHKELLDRLIKYCRIISTEKNGCIKYMVKNGGYKFENIYVGKG